MAAFSKAGMRIACLLARNSSVSKTASNDLSSKAFIQTCSARSTLLKPIQPFTLSCAALQLSKIDIGGKRNDERSISSLSRTSTSQNINKINNIKNDIDSTLKRSSSSSTDSSDDKEKTKSNWSTWKIAGYGAAAVFGVLGAASGLYLFHSQGEPDFDEEGNVIEDEFGGDSFVSNCKRYVKRVQDPSRRKLLPDPLEYPYIQPPYTLVMEMKGVLVWPEHDLKSGWRFKKRPGVKYLIQKTCDLFEIVIYTSEGGMNMDPIISQIDPHGFIKYRLYRDTTKYVGNHHVKDLSYLNRDLSKVIMVDCDENSYQLQPRNGLKIKKYEGDDDNTLVDLVSFLTALAATGVEDVRPVLDYYKQFDDPIFVFKENQRKLMEEQQALEQQQKPASRFGGIGGFFKR